MGSETTKKGIGTAELVNTVYNFCAILTGIKLYPYQEQYSKRVIRSVLTNDSAEITALFARQSGKSEAVSVTVAGMMVILPALACLPMFALDKRLAMFRKGLWVGIFAPSQRQAQITFGRIKSRLQSKEAVRVLASPEFGLSFSTSNGQTVSLTNGSFATSISASEQSNIEGESFMLLIAEETQDISNSVLRKSISPMGAAYNATFCKIGTATTYRGDFYYAIQRNKKEHERKKAAGWTGIVRNHFEYDCDVAAKYNPRYGKYIERERKILGEKSDAFRMSYKLEWIFQRGMFVELNEFLTKCGDPRMERVSGDMKAVHVAGIDIGGTSKHGDPDSTVITIAEVDWTAPAVHETRTDSFTNEETTFAGFDVYVRDWREIADPDYERQYAEIAAYLRRFNVRRAVVDATRETSVAHRLRANMPFDVVPYVFGGKSKSDLYKHLEREINGGRLRVPLGENTVATREFDRFISQMEDLQKDYRGALLQVSHPPGRGCHDDYPDSLALCVFGASYEGAAHAAETYDTRSVFGGPGERTRTKNALTARRRRGFPA